MCLIIYLRVSGDYWCTLQADKASILGDAIVYLKDLQDRIEGLQMNRAQSERRYEALQKSYKELQDRNKELESMVHNTATRLHSI